jgi:hypothetical protein
LHSTHSLSGAEILSFMNSLFSGRHVPIRLLV